MQRTTSGFLFLFLSLSILVVCVSAEPYWTQTGRDAQHTYNVPDPDDSRTPLWSFPYFQASVPSAPLIYQNGNPQLVTGSDGIVFYVSGTGSNVTAFNTTNALLWEKDLNQELKGNVLAFSNLAFLEREQYLFLYVNRTTGGALVIQLSAKDGSIISSVPVVGRLWSSPLLTNSSKPLLLVTQIIEPVNATNHNNTRVLAFNATKALTTPVWQFNATNSFLPTGPVLLADQTFVYVLESSSHTAGQSTLNLLDVVSGAVKHTIPITPSGHHYPTLNSVLSDASALVLNWHANVTRLLLKFTQDPPSTVDITPFVAAAASQSKSILYGSSIHPSESSKHKGEMAFYIAATQLLPNGTTLRKWEWPSKDEDKVHQFFFPNVTRAKIAVDKDAVVYVYLTVMGNPTLLVGLDAVNGTLLWLNQLPADPHAYVPVITASSKSQADPKHKTRSLVMVPQTSGLANALSFSVVGCCSGNGDCQPPSGGAMGSCVCDTNFFSANCSVFCSREKACNAHGTCNATTGACICDANFYTDDCSNYCLASDTCNGHGVCNATGFCSCDSFPFYGFYAYSGDSCKQIVNLTMIAAAIVAILITVVLVFFACVCYGNYKASKHGDYAPLSTVVHQED